MNNSPYKMVVGLEVHVQLNTTTKLFCGCSTAFGRPPNTQTCPVCLGLPGALPVMNRQAIELAVRTGLALNSTIPSLTKWDRKNYFYPDLPKGYQISQFDLPIAAGGYLEIHDPKGRFPDRRVGLIRAHLEEDAGKSLHDDENGEGLSRIDLNRTGTPLLEIVSAPEIHSPIEAHAYLDALKLLLTYLDVSDCNMQEGSLRVDANVNLHLESEQGTIATPIVEVKNLNSFRAVERALMYEGDRQYEAWRENGLQLGQAPKVTRGWNDSQQATFVQREKEESSDYRYFPDPDLVPVTLSPDEISAAREKLGELPEFARKRLVQNYRLTPYDAGVIVNQGRLLLAYFEEVAEQSDDAKRAANWIQQDVMRVLNEHNTTIDAFPITAASLAELIREIISKTLDNSRAKDVFQAMLNDSISVADAKQKLGIVAVNADELAELCQKLIEQNAAVIDEIRGGKQQAIGALIGKARKINPNVNPGQLRGELLKRIASDSSD